MAGSKVDEPKIFALLLFSCKTDFVFSELTSFDSVGNEVKHGLGQVGCTRTSTLECFSHAKGM
jgi:hypothetical protein